MKRDAYWRAGLSFGFGALCLILRLLQNRNGFDPETGLSLSSAAGTALPVCLVLLLALELFLSWKTQTKAKSFQGSFTPPGREILLPVAGGLLLAAGGAVRIARLLGGGLSSFPLILGALSVLAGAGALFLLWQRKNRDRFSSGALLPLLLCCGTLMLYEFLRASQDPVLLRSYLPVLASVSAAYAWCLAAGFFRGEGRPRRFAIAGGMAAALCLAVMADGALDSQLTYLGLSFSLLSLLLSMRPEVM